MVPRAQVHDADVAFAHAEHEPRDDFVQLDLVEFGLCDRLNANRTAGNLASERIVALLDLAVVVRLDRTEVERVLLERGGGVFEVIRVAEHLVAQTEEDDGRDFWIVSEHVLDRRLRSAVRRSARRSGNAESAAGAGCERVRSGRSVCRRPASRSSRFAFAPRSPTAIRARKMRTPWA